MHKKRKHTENDHTDQEYLYTNAFHEKKNVKKCGLQ